MARKVAGKGVVRKPDPRIISRKELRNLRQSYSVQFGSPEDAIIYRLLEHISALEDQLKTPGG